MFDICKEELPVNPVAPLLPVAPVALIDPAAPVDPVDPTAPVDPVAPVDLDTPGSPAFPDLPKPMRDYRVRQVILFKETKGNGFPDLRQLTSPQLGI